ncbi:hypothetical protein [Microlunatus sp. Y2014]|uniref:antitoxin VbhA family protein n=1 Tax=Microlunatus sp. Y2014 TaxID=3418488 RepID=UPI003DA74537
MPSDTSDWDDQLAELTPLQRDAVLATIAGNIADGVEPTKEDVARLAAVARGELTAEQIADSFRQS